MSSSLILYDIASSLPEQTFSPNTAKARYALNVKGIPHRTVFLEYHEIEPTCKKIGAKPTGDSATGYSLPVLYDPATNTAISDSIEIARYLDVTYPSSLPVLIPKGTTALHYAFIDAHAAVLLPLYTYALPATLSIVNPVSQAYFRRTREALFGGKRLEDVVPTGEAHVEMWKEFEAGFGKIDAWYRKNENGGKGEYFMGEDTISYADITVVGYLRWANTVLGKDLWEDIAGWHGGRWGRLRKAFEKYDKVIV
ncbi:hypothetical protein FB45DRAFT_763101 [Roridomyces roridus]|uniref:GST N-terminal domain-containing protein n=1 Tax=Roridomyces roridus TaxID=1738132 RepID=A0AAD7FAS6_9AGAR|nr:hypothetical protein FB45DRAFT_763101 [Roridomyces roridus]